MEQWIGGVVDEERYGIAELAEAADVSVRTVRYYIAEGLLPPPVTAGARSYYTGEHLARLRLIGRLKDAYLPLREIRRYLSALDDATIRELAETEAGIDDEEAELLQEGPELVESAPWEPHAIADMIKESFPPGFPFHNAGKRDKKHKHRDRSAGKSESASDYIAMALGAVERARRATAPPPSTQQRASAAPNPPFAPPPSSAPDSETEPVAFQEASAPPTETLWRHIRISDDAQLLIREEAFGRRLEKIEWLIGWAKKVLG